MVHEPSVPDKSPVPHPARIAELLTLLAHVEHHNRAVLHPVDKETSHA